MVKEIENLIYSSNEDDVILGFRLLCQKIKHPTRIRKYIHDNIGVLNLEEDHKYLDLFFDEANILISDNEVRVFRKNIKETVEDGRIVDFRTKINSK